MTEKLRNIQDCPNFHKKIFICGALRDLIPFVQFKKRAKHPWRSVTFSKVVGFSMQLTKSNTPTWVFLTFFKLYEWYQIAQSTTYIENT